MPEVQSTPIQDLYNSLSAKQPQIKERGFEGFSEDMKDTNNVNALYESLSKTQPQIKDRGIDGFKSDMFGEAQQITERTTSYIPEVIDNGKQLMGSIPATRPDLSIKNPEYFAPKISDSYQTKNPVMDSIVMPQGGGDQFQAIDQTQLEKEVGGAQIVQEQPLGKVDQLRIDYLRKTHGDEYADQEQAKMQSPELATEERGFVSKLGGVVGNEFMSGVNNLNSWVAAAPGFVYDLAGIPFRAAGLNVPTSKDFKDKPLLDISDYYKQNAKSYEERVNKINPERDKGITAAFEQGDIETGVLNLAGSVSQSLPASLAMILSGGATVPTILGGAVVFGAGKAQEIEEDSPEMNYDKGRVIAAINGTLEGVFETYLGSGAVGKSLSNIIKREGAEVAQKQAKKSIRNTFVNMITENPWLAPLGEGFEEVGTQLAQNIVDKYSGYKPDINITDGVSDSFLSGITMGGMHGAVIGLAKKSMEDKNGTEEQQPLSDTTQLPTVNPRDTRQAEARQFAEGMAHQDTGVLTTIEEITGGTDVNNHWFVKAGNQNDVDGSVLVENENGDRKFLTKDQIAGTTNDMTVDDFVKGEMQGYDQGVQDKELMKQNQIQVDGKQYVLTGDQTKEGYIALDPEQGTEITIPAKDVDAIRNSGKRNANLVQKVYGKTNVTGVKNEDGSITVSEPMLLDQVQGKADNKGIFKGGLIQTVESTSNGEATVEWAVINKENITDQSLYQATIKPYKGSANQAKDNRLIAEQVKLNESVTSEASQDSGLGVKPSYPLDKDGQPDIDSMDDNQLFDYTSETDGIDVALKDVQDNIDEIDNSISKEKETLLSEKDLKKKAKLRLKISNLQKEKENKVSLLETKTTTKLTQSPDTQMPIVNIEQNGSQINQANEKLIEQTGEPIIAEQGKDTQAQEQGQGELEGLEENVIHAGSEPITEIDETKLQSRDSGQYGKGFYVARSETNQPFYGKVKSYFAINKDAKTLNKDTFDVEDWKRTQVESNGFDYNDVLTNPGSYDFEDVLKVQSFSEAVSYDNKAINDYARSKGFDVLDVSEDEIIILNKNAVTTQSNKNTISVEQPAAISEAVAPIVENNVAPDIDVATKVKPKKANPIVEDTSVVAELTPEQRVTAQNKVIDLVDDYNSIPRNHTNKRRIASQQIRAGVQELGYSTTESNGKTEVQSEGKKINKIGTKQTAEDIQAHKALADYSPEAQSFIQRFLDNPTELYGLDLTASAKQSTQGVKNINEGKKTVAANDVLDSFEKMFNDGVVRIKGSKDNNYHEIPIQEYLSTFDSQESELGPDQLSDNARELLWEVAGYYGLTSEQIEEIDNLFINHGYTSQIDTRTEAASDRSSATNEKVRGTEKEVPSQAKAGLTPIEKEIEALKAERAELLKKKGKTVAQVNSRNGLFGDTSTQAGDLFNGEGFNATEGQRIIDTANKRIQTIDQVIKDLTQKVQAVKETAEKENAGQGELAIPENKESSNYSIDGSEKGSLLITVGAKKFKINKFGVVIEIRSDGSLDPTGRITGSSVDDASLVSKIAKENSVGYDIDSRMDKVYRWNEAEKQSKQSELEPTPTLTEVLIEGKKVVEGKKESTEKKLSLGDKPEDMNTPEYWKDKTVTYLHNPNPSPNVGSRFGQDVEPSGKYITIGHQLVPQGYVEGQVMFKNPLVIDVTDQEYPQWKVELSKKYNAKGKKLTDKILKDGYDSIITVEKYKGKYEPSETIILNPEIDSEKGIRGKKESTTLPEVKQPEKKPLMDILKEGKDESLSKRPEKIEDFGEKLGGAKKDIVRKYFNKINLNGMTLSTIFPKPDIKELLASGLSNKEVSAIKVAYEFAQSEKKNTRRSKDAQIGAIRFCASYAKTVLSENLNVEFNNEGWVFTDHGKQLIQLRTTAFENVAQELGSDFLNLDLSKFQISELTEASKKNYVKKPEGNFKVQYYVNQSKYFDTPDQAMNEFVEQVKANTTTDKVEYKRKLNIYYSRKGEGSFIGYQPSGKEVIRLKEGFKTSTEAFEYKKEHEADLQTMLERIMAESRATKKGATRVKYYNETTRDRVGNDHRGGKDIPIKEFADTFGFKAVEFGNWATQAERQLFLSNVYDSLMDLTEILKVPAKALSLNGELSLSFGSRGSGAALAHYEPERKVINLTKNRGIGSLAHEFFHGLDNYFAGFKVGMSSMKSAVAGESTPEIRAELKELFKKLYDSFGNGFKTRSRSLDDSKSKNYFGLPHEMGARAFENYILGKLNESGQINDFLVNYVSNEGWEGNASQYPYPVGEESKTINESFDNLFGAIQTKEEGGQVPMFRIASKEETFYSPTEKALGKIQQNKGSIDQFKAMLLKNGAKQAEMDWMGWDDFAEGKKNVTREEIQEWIDGNKIEVKEVTKESNTQNVNEKINGIPELHELIFSTEWANDNSGKLEPRAIKIITDNGFTKVQALKWLHEEDSTHTVDNTKFSQYVEPGGENYKELLLTLPKKAERIPVHSIKEESEYEKKGYYIETDFSDNVTYNGVVDEKTYAVKKSQDFKSSHYDEPNILAHVRFNERTGQNGERVLFVEEFQSDWAQKGKKEGFSTNLTYEIVEPSKEMQDNGDYNYTAIIKNAKGEEVKRNSLFQLPNLKQWAQNEVGKGSVPSMPFSKTDQWVNLAFRRMMKYAVENGFDRIAWTNGVMQAARYNLSATIESIDYGSDGSLVAYDKSGSQVMGKTVSENQLEEHIGKEAAEKLLTQEPDADGERHLKNQDLKVGGSGMKAFYDAIVPSAANKLGKPFGARVEPAIKKKEALSYDQIQDMLTDFNKYPTGSEERKALRKQQESSEDTEHNVLSTVQSLPVTESMRESVMNGVPMFQIIGEKGAANIGTPTEAKQAIEHLQSTGKANRKVRFQSKAEIVSYLEANSDKYTQSTIDNVKSINFSALQIDDELFFNSDLVKSKYEAVRDWVHENMHAQIQENTPDATERADALTALYDTLGEKEIRRIVPKEYWNQSNSSQANEYLAHAAQGLATDGVINSEIRPDVKKIILNIVGQFTTLKNIQDAKAIRTNLSNQEGSRGNENVGTSNGREVRPGNSLDGREGNNSNTSIRSSERDKGGVNKSIPLLDYLQFAKEKAMEGKNAIDIVDLKQKQLDIIMNANPMLDDYHTGIRNIDDINTFEEAYKKDVGTDNFVTSPDHTQKDIEDALKNGSITIYSSYPIKNGVFVTPSKMEAELYAGGEGRKVYSKKVDLNKVAWIDNYEGQYAEIKNTKNPNTILINGVSRSTLNSNGKPLAQTEEGIRNFYKWFGDSKVVDAEGSPLVVYHGTVHKFNAFSKDELGKTTNSPSAFQGFFFTNKAYNAYQYLGQIYSLYPKHFDVNREVHEIERQEGFKSETVEFWKKRATQRLAKAVNIFMQKLIKTNKTIINSSLQKAEDDLYGLAGKKEYTENVYKELKAWISKYESLFGKYQGFFKTAENLQEFENRLSSISNETIIDIAELGRQIYNKIPEHLKLEKKYVEEYDIKQVYLKSESQLMFDDEGSGFSKEEFERKDSYFNRINEAIENENDGVVIKDTKDPLLNDVYVVFSPSQIKSATGNDGSFDPNNPDINFKKEKTEPLSDFLANAAKEYQEKKNTKRNFAEIKEKVREFIQDRDLPIRRLEELVKSLGGKITDTMKPYRDMSLSYGRTETLYTNFTDQKMIPIIETIAKIRKSGVSELEVLPYMISKHAIERNAFMRKNEMKEWQESAEIDYQKWADSNTGVTQAMKDRKAKEFQDEIKAMEAKLANKDYSGVKGFDPENTFENPDDLAREIVKLFEDKVSIGLIDELWENTKGASSEIVDFWKNGQTMSKEQAQATKDRYQYFIPLRGWREGAAKQLTYKKGEGFSTSLKHAKGRSSFADNPLAYFQTVAFKAIGEQTDNEVNNALLNLVVGNYGDEFQKMYELKKAYYVQDGLDDEGATMWRMTLDRPSEEQFKSGEAKTKIYEQYQKLRTPTEAHEHEVYIKRPGGDMIVVMKDEFLDVAQAMGKKNSMYRNLFNGKINDADFWNKPLGATFGVLNNTLKAMYTSWNVVFPLTNFSRDVQEASITQFIKGERGEKVLANYSKAFPVIVRQMRGKKGTSKHDELFKRFKLSGGNTGFTHQKTPEELEQEVNSKLKTINRKGTLRGYTTDQLSRVMGGIESWNQIFEDATRFSVFITSVELGKSDRAAAYDAKEASVNFNRKGKSSKAFDSIWAFWNVALQSMQKNFKLAKDHPGRFGIVAGSWLALGFFEAMMNDSGDDDEYYNISEYVRENYLILPTGGDKYIRIPLPQFWRGFKSAGSLAYDVMRGKIDPLAASAKGVSNFMGGLLPIDIGGLYTEGEFSIAPFIPTIVKPMYEVKENRDYMNHTIVKEPFTKEQERILANSGLGKGNVNPAIKFLTDYLFRSAGGEGLLKYHTIGNSDDIEKVPGIFDINPSVIEHLLKGYTGGTGAFVIDAMTTAMQGFSNDKEVDFKNIPFVNQFIKKIPEAKWKIIGEYYDLQSEGNESVFGQLKTAYFNNDDKSKFIGLATSQYQNRYKAVLDMYDKKLTAEMEHMDYKTAEGSEQVTNTMQEAIKAIKELKKTYNKK